MSLQFLFGALRVKIHTHLLKCFATLPCSSSALFFMSFIDLRASASIICGSSVLTKINEGYKHSVELYSFKNLHSD